MRTFLSTILLGVTLVAPAALRADDRDKHHREKRYYDRDARDWHECNEQEERAFHRYMQEKRRQQRDWAKMNREEQREYWRWRHTHPDETLFGDRR